MKRYLLLLLITASSALQALPVGNPWEASLYTEGVFCPSNCPTECDAGFNLWEAWSVRLGYYGDFVNDRHLGISTSHDNIRQTEIWTNAGYLALNFCNHYDLFATLGVSRFLINAPSGVFTLAQQSYAELSTDTQFSWSLGVRGTIWECGCFGIGGEAQYFRANSDVNYFQSIETLSPVYPNTAFNYREWQAGLGASYWINMSPLSAVPYVAVKWARALASMSDQFTTVSTEVVRLRNLNSRRGWGYAIGLTLVGCQKFGLTLEKRFVDENAFYINAQVRF